MSAETDSHCLEFGCYEAQATGMPEYTCAWGCALRAARIRQSEEIRKAKESHEDG